MAGLLEVLTKVTDNAGTPLDDAEEVRVKSPLTITRIASLGSGPVRVELGVAGGIVAGITGTAPIAVSAGLSPVVSIAAASSSVAGSMSAADKTKLDTVTAGAKLENLGTLAPLTLGGSATFPVVGISAASGSTAGTMSIAHFNLVNNATDAATGGAISKRNGSGDISYNLVTAELLHIGGESSTFAADIGFTPHVDTYAAHVELAGREGGKHEVTLTGNVIFDDPIAYAPGSTLKVRVIQGGTGSYTGTWSGGTGGFYFGTGFSGTLIATTTGDADYFEFEHWTNPVSHWVCTIHFKYSPP